MQYEATDNTPNPQAMIAGIQKNDHSIEFFGIHSTMQVRFLQNGQTHNFNEIKGTPLRLIVNAFEADREAKAIIKTLQLPDGSYAKYDYNRMLELYVYFCYGHLDGTPDIKDNVLCRPENYRHRRDCISLQFKHKTLHINGNPLKPREITMIDGFTDDDTDVRIADRLGIALPTFNQHKRTLFNKAGTACKTIATKTAFMIVAAENKLLTR